MRRAQGLKIIVGAALAGLTLAGCATARYATELPPEGAAANGYPAPPPAAGGYATTPRAAPAVAVEQGTLNEPSRSRSARGGRAIASTAPPSTGRGLSRPPVMATPRQVIVQDGDTLASLGERWRTPVQALIEANRLQPPYDLATGATLVIPAPLVYETQDGDTLFGVARRFAMDPRSLASLNDIPLETTLARGRRLALPSLARDGGGNAQASGPSPTGLSESQRMASTPPPRLREEPSSSRTYARPPGATGVTGMAGAAGPTRRGAKTAADAQVAVAAAAAREPSLSAGPATDNQVSQAGRGRFVWPMKGALLSGFGAKGPGQRNDGVDLAASPGEPVKAAAGGEVVYAGGAIAAFGNLVLVKHAGGWVTAYAHLAKIEVAMRQSVSQGQEIGQAGQTGAVDQPQLHFEVRYAPDPSESAKPVDPSLVLPRSGQ